MQWFVFLSYMYIILVIAPELYEHKNLWPKANLP